MTLLRADPSPGPPDATPSHAPLLLYIPGADGTGQAITPQLPSLQKAGVDLRIYYLPPGYERGWEEMTQSAVSLLRTQLTPERRRVTLVAESFGACLALRIALAAPELVERMVLINPATSFTQSLNGLASLAAATNLLALFPARLYDVAQEVILPILVNKDSVAPGTAEAMQRMMSMEPPAGMTPASGVPPMPAAPAPAAWPHTPSRTASHRLDLLRSGALNEDQLQRIECPVLLIASVQDRMFPSVAHGVYLQARLPQSQRLVLYNSGHTPMLESGVNLVDIMRGADFLEGPPTPVGPSAEGSAALTPAGLRSYDGVDAAWAENDAVMWAWRALVAPLVLGGEHLPSPSLAGTRPVLFVGNHTRYGLYDLPHLMQELWFRGIRVKGLAHPAHWAGPMGGLFERFGAVKATPRAAYRLLRAGEAVLLFPGGGKEVNKPRGDDYKLLWGERPEFVRMASKLGAIIVPFSAVGGDDAFPSDGIAADSEEILNSFVGPAVRSAMARFVPELDPAEGVSPISYLPGTRIPTPVPVPRLERCYFSFAEPIDTVEYACDIGSPAECEELYERVQRDVLEGIARLQAIQATDPERYILQRIPGQLETFRPALDTLLKGTRSV